jgi:hypothetical protein
MDLFYGTKVSRVKQRSEMGFYRGVAFDAPVDPGIFRI